MNLQDCVYKDIQIVAEKYAEYVSAANASKVEYAKAKAAKKAAKKLMNHYVRTAEIERLNYLKAIQDIRANYLKVQK